MRYTGPRVRIMRRLGRLPGFTTKKLKKTTTPGDHPQENNNKRLTVGDDYKERLLEKQKLRYNYGVRERQMIYYLKEAKRREGSTEINLLKLLELRLDSIVFRLGFGRTIPEARQIINHGHVLVNEQKITIPSFECCLGDQIQMSKTIVAQKIGKKNIQIKEKILGHLEIDKNLLQGTIISMPNRLDLDFEINELKVVEYYSR